MTADGVLVRRLTRDLDAAFPELVVQTQALVFNGARRWLPTSQDAEDITQEVYVRAYQALAKYPPEQIAGLNLRPWLFTITINLCRNHARTRARRPRQVELANHGDVGATPDAELPALELETAQEWRVRLAALPRRQREAIVLRHVVGLTYDEAGQVLRVPAGTVKSDVHRGLGKLRAILAEEDST